VQICAEKRTQFASSKNMTSFVFNDFLASFPLFCIFSSVLLLIDAGAIPPFRRHRLIRAPG